MDPAGGTPALESARAPERTRTKLEASSESDPGDEAIPDLRAERFGAQAAARLAELDEAQAPWSERLSTFQAERRRLEAEAAAASDEAREQAVDALMREHFDGEEPRRVAPLEDS